jgi:hypothetical protein
MTFKIGDRVKFLNDEGGGIIIAFLDNKTVEVQTDDGFEMPIPANEILFDSGSVYGFDGEDRKQNEPKKPAQSESMVYMRPEDYKYEDFKGEILLGIVPDNDKLLHVSDFRLYLINDSNYSMLYLVSQVDKGVHELVNQGVIEKDSKLELKKYNQSSLSKVTNFYLQCILYKSGLFEPQKAFELNVSLDGISFYKSAHFTENDYFNEKAILFRKEKISMKEVVEKLQTSDILKVSVAKEEKTEIKKEKKIVNPEIIEVDLHIEEIVESHAGMSNGEIIEIQLGRFETSLETAIRSKAKKIVFIHGVGNGRLKQEIQKKLERKYPDLRFQDASFREYGFGATMVYLKS